MEKYKTIQADMSKMHEEHKIKYEESRRIVSKVFSIFFYFIFIVFKDLKSRLTRILCDT